MAIHLAGTFDYVAVVSERPGGSEFECLGAVRHPVDTTSDPRSGARLVGLTPLIRVTDAGLTPDAGPRRPWVMRSRITLRASGPLHASVLEASFHVDRALIASTRPGDELHLRRTGCGGLGVSVVRGGDLVVAAGAITAVCLGRAVEARVPRDLTSSAETLFRQRDPEFRFRELPVEVSVAGARAILYGGYRTLEGYQVFVDHGFLDGTPGTEACGAIYRKGLCPDVAAEASAMLLDEPGALTMSR